MSDNLNIKKGALQSIADLMPDKAETMAEIFGAANKSGNPVEIKSKSQPVSTLSGENILIFGSSYYIELKTVTEKNKELVCKIRYGFLIAGFKLEDRKNILKEEAIKVKKILYWGKSNFPEVRVKF